MASSKITCSIVTPSYKQLHWLKLCLASVNDQQGVTFEHIIQDAVSGEDLADWVRCHSPAKLFVESDSGMYDAINRGFRKATGEIVAWLNCDEQYLPGTLQKVATFFERHPEIDVLFGDAVLLSEQGELLSYRRAILPSLFHIKLSHLNTLSCATFVRRSVITRGLFLEPQWKAIADAVWVAEMFKAKLRMAVLPEPLATFTMTDENLGQTSLALKESERWCNGTTTAFLRALRSPVVLLHRIRKYFHGAYESRTLSIEVYTHASRGRRVQVSAENLSFAWTRSTENGSGLLSKKIMATLRRIYQFHPAKAKSQIGALTVDSGHRMRFPSLFFVIAPLLIGAAIFALETATPDLLISPLISTLLLLLLSFYLSPLQLVPFILVFLTVILISLCYLDINPFNPTNMHDWVRVGLRVFGFTTASVMATFLSKSRHQAEARLKQTFGIITTLPVPVIISDATGIIVFMNDEALEFMKISRSQVPGARYVEWLMADKNEGAAMRDYIKFFQNSAAADGSEMAQKWKLLLKKGDGTECEIQAKLICLGEGEERSMATVLSLW